MGKIFVSTNGRPEMTIADQSEDLELFSILLVSEWSFLVCCHLLLIWIYPFSKEYKTHIHYNSHIQSIALGEYTYLFNYKLQAWHLFPNLVYVKFWRDL